MKKLSAIVLILLAWLQYTLWFGQSGHFAQLRMRNELERHHERAESLEQGNLLLTAEVLAMKQDPGRIGSPGAARSGHGQGWGSVLSDSPRR